MKKELFVIAVLCGFLTSCSGVEFPSEASARSGEENWVESYHFEEPEVTLESSNYGSQFGFYYLYETEGDERTVVNNWEFLSVKAWLYNPQTQEESYIEPECGNQSSISLGQYDLCREQGEYGMLLFVGSNIIPTPGPEEITAIVRIGKVVDGIVHYGQIRIDIVYKKSPCWGVSYPAYYEELNHRANVEAKGGSVFVTDTDFYDFLNGNTPWDMSLLKITWSDGTETGTDTLPTWLTVKAAEENGVPGLELTFSANEDETPREVVVFKRIENECQPAELTLRLTQAPKSASLPMVVA